MTSAVHLIKNTHRITNAIGTVTKNSQPNAPQMQLLSLQGSLVINSVIQDKSILINIGKNPKIPIKNNPAGNFVNKFSLRVIIIIPLGNIRYSFYGFYKLAYNVSRTREVAKQAKRVLSAKIEFIRENGADATQNQQFLVTAVRGSSLINIYTNLKYLIKMDIFEKEKSLIIEALLYLRK